MGFDHVAGPSLIDSLGVQRDWTPAGALHAYVSHLSTDGA
jgi:hypothetical protein